MNKNWQCITRVLLLAAVLLSSVARPPCTLAADSGATPLAGRIVVLGDSITYGGLWVEYLETALRLSGRLEPGAEFLNLGLPSETASGLSEPGHAGGQFPRPDLHERLERVLKQTQPDIIIACYGMNDGIYYPLASDRFEKFQQGVLRLQARVSEAGARIVYLTPPVFDPEPIRARTLPAGLPAYPQPFAGYNEVLDEYAAWLVSHRGQGWAVVDIHSQLNAFLQAHRAKDPAFILAGDGVHPGAQGHWLIARSVLNFLGVAEFTSDDDPGRAFERHPHGSELLAKVAERQRVLKDAWLTEVGHQRPGMAKGLPLAEAQARAAIVDTQIRTLHGRSVFPGPTSSWHGFVRFDFPAGERTASVIVPRAPLPGNPWAWKGEFLDAFPEVEIALLSNGFHVVYLSTPDMLGSPEAVRLWNLAYQDLTQRYKLAPKVALIALSRAGLYCYNWGASNPEKVACIYADAAVCDFKSWPGGRGKGKGSPRDWELVLRQYHFQSERQALEYRFNPIDNLAPLAAAKIPLLHVYGDADDVVPWEENTGVIAERYRKLGGSITLISKPGVGHHPHGLEDPTRIVEFIQTHARVTTSAK